jgi:predicted DNA-binding transcriptional regulator AlpA
MSNNNSPIALLTEEQVAELLALSVRTLQAWRLRGAGPLFVRAGRAIRYQQSELAEWIAANTVVR